MVTTFLEKEASTGSASQTAEKKPENGGAVLVSASHQAINPYRISAHACKWHFRLEGAPGRGNFKEVTLRSGVIVRYWRFMRCTIQANRKTLFISAKTGKRASTRQALYAAWNKVDLARRAFSTWQQVGIMPEETARLAGALKADVVVEAPRALIEALTPFAPVSPASPMAVRSELRRDGSHGFKPEMNLEAGEGMDYLLLDLKRERQEEILTDAERWRSIEAEITLVHAETAKLAEGIAAVLKTLRE